MKLIIMAAGSGKRMGAALAGKPKCLIEVGGRTLLDWQLDAWEQAGGEREDVVIVTGCGAEHLQSMSSRGCSLVHNDNFATTNMVQSLFCAQAHFNGGFVMSYGDIAYQPNVMAAVRGCRNPIGVVVDTQWRGYWAQRFDDVLADAESLATDGHGRITSIGQKTADASEIEAQYIGLVSFRSSGVQALRDAFALAQSGSAFAHQMFSNLYARPAATMFMTDLLMGMIALGAPVSALPIAGGWVEIDAPSDLDVAETRLAATTHATCEAEVAA